MKLFLLALFIVVSSCKTNKNYIGQYVNVKPSKQEFKSFKTKSSLYITNSKLSLNKDSTYLYKSCGLLSYGNWIFNNDSIILKPKKVFSMSDSINPIKNDLENYTFRFKALESDNVLVGKVKDLEKPGTYLMNKFVLED
ncbi:hypothetical protein [Aurantibacter aestuarii]|uniref:Lipoprotein n=1 Tax=Aurantibacter aestuarii TaxID=1266046 RepID=A0A2T1NEF2_9FLAO|nr:hypothetical protein [Aurantibacter aestuarii]PSG90779.1 hypothetical protein C7H52_05760 [Aurantibacter aestuarii]